MAVNANELPPELLESLGLAAGKKASRRVFTKESVRQHAIRCLAPLDKLTQDQRRRVLEHALKMNKT